MKRTVERIFWVMGLAAALATAAASYVTGEKAAPAGTETSAPVEVAK